MGLHSKKLLSDSSASNTTRLLDSARILEQNSLLSAPMSAFASFKIALRIAVVVLLPCAPATANTSLLPRIILSDSLRDNTAIFCLCASCTSTLSGLIIEEWMTKSCPQMASLECGIVTFTPIALSSLVMQPSATSDPLISTPCARKNFASAEIPIPPMPIKWILLMLISIAQSL